MIVIPFLCHNFLVNLKNIKNEIIEQQKKQLNIPLADELLFFRELSIFSSIKNPLLQFKKSLIPRK